eukprot:365394-Chlamydomonas_euryale.AAC.9
MGLSAWLYACADMNRWACYPGGSHCMQRPPTNWAAVRSHTAAVAQQGARQQRNGIHKCTLAVH